MKNRKIKIKLKCEFFDCVLKKLYAYGICVKILKSKENFFIISILKKDFEIVKKVLKDNSINILEVKNSFCFSKKHFGFYAGCILLIFLIPFFQSRIFGIKIIGNKDVAKNEIISFLNEKEVKFFSSKNKIKTKEIEMQLLNEFKNIGLVSVGVKGNNLIVSIKEKNIEDETLKVGENIVSDCFGTIMELNIKSGSTKFRVGDAIKIGDVLVEGKEEGKNVIPRAIIKIREYLVKSNEMLFEEKKFVKTKNYVENMEGRIFGVQFKLKHKNAFVKYKRETEIRRIGFLTLKIHKDYELKEIIKKNSLEKDGEYFRLKSEEEVKKILPLNANILDKYNFTSQNKYGIIFTSVIVIEKIIM